MTAKDGPQSVRKKKVELNLEECMSIDGIKNVSQFFSLL